MSWWTLFQRPAVSRHECSPIPIDVLYIEIKYHQLQDYAAFEKVQYIYKTSECPICKNRYTYDDPVKKSLGTISYQEFYDLKGKL